MHTFTSVLLSFSRHENHSLKQLNKIKLRYFCITSESQHHTPITATKGETQGH